MKRSSIETIVLVVGVAIIGIALFFMFSDNEDPSKSIFITNLIFSFGFLVYIVYSIMSANSLNKEIRGLNKHLDGLKHEIAKYKKQIADKDAEIQNLQQDLVKKDEALNLQTEKVNMLEKRLSDLESSGADSDI
ncbi:uncharacterized protein containing a divergent version of the methyl-accepting chemotaxis-like domain [Owenweeksia hongkongensis DSM 17368]|uniref:Uncharacterized protein containing a divergent version of the methyl-accepting chemotaxis-like domain n=1 Tax=Owenweeksia hongkongensis (strain DSM 17368 / CIP 108786 / JCM 12287 / NRRL B-23963 / UST20020801) TaxID=926562 RepID=G8R5H7_OWEHD|nr:DUF948 domain-containing protein [Owenweeksia hongkongensis]AEV33251.1 uncharacterized protein containing a divergent version of the methyl-accepting chemotaxis-like domain [Owenweeksia hongkongensis DSM 17368]